MEFYYSNLCARSAGLATAQNWRRYFAGKGILGPRELPSLGTHSRLTRRLDILGKLSLAVLQDMAWKPQEPLVFASNWGDIGRSKELLYNLADSGEVSPAGFTTSVHNAIAAIAAIGAKNHSFSPAIAAGSLTTEAALCQGYLLAETGAASIIVLRAEMPMPPNWDLTIEENCKEAYAWALRLTIVPNEESRHLQLTPISHGQGASDESTDTISSDLRFLFGPMRSRQHTDSSGRGWLWEK